MRMKKNGCSWRGCLVVVFLGAAGGCGSSGGACASCQTNADCNPGETCSEFEDSSGDVQYLCADASTSTCEETSYY
jgi:hypothetical protein